MARLVRLAVGSLILISALLTDSAIGAPIPPRPEKLVLVTLDGARAGLDAWPEVAPNFSRLARAGIRFERATTPSPLTFPATASMLTGLPPWRSGVRDEALRPLGSMPTLASRLAGRGYSTVGLPVDRFCHAGTGIGRGFQVFLRESPALSDSARVDTALALLSRPGRQFVWIGLSLLDPVKPWRRYRGLPDSDAYAQRAAGFDAALERLVTGLERAQLLDASLLVIAGTHGQAVPGLGDRAGGRSETLAGHGPSLDDESLRVPLVLHYPGSLPTSVERARHRWVSTLDLAPTLAEAAGVPGAFAAEGRSFWMLLAGAESKTRAFRHETDVQRTLGWSPRAILRQGERSTSETSPGSSSDSEEERCYRELVQTLPDIDPPPDSAALARLAILRERCPSNPLLQLETAVTRSRLGQDHRAAALFIEVIERNPDYPEATLAYADHLLRHRHFELVARALERIPAGSPLAVEAAWRRAHALAGALEMEAATRAFEQALELGPAPGNSGLQSRDAWNKVVRTHLEAGAQPQDAGRLVAYARALGEFGLFEECYRQLHQARMLTPGEAEGDRWLGHFLLLEGRPQHASLAFARALERDRNHVPSLRGLADALAVRGQKNEALPHLLRAVELEPADARSRYNLACLLAAAGWADRAIAELEKAVELGYADWDLIRTDSDLSAVRSLPRYRSLLERAPGGQAAKAPDGPR